MIAPLSDPWGQEMILVVMKSAELCVLPGLGHEMGCSSPTSLQAACGAHGHDWCDAGCHWMSPRGGDTCGVLHGPMLTSPHHCPHCRCWGGLAVKPQLSSCVQTAQISARVQMRWGHPQCQGRLRGDSQPRMVLGEASALLTQQLFLLSQQVQPPAGSVCWGGHPHPPGPGHSSGATELVGTSPTTPNLLLTAEPGIS